MPPVAKKAQPKAAPKAEEDKPVAADLSDDEKDSDAPEVAESEPDTDDNAEGQDGTDDPDELVWVEEPCAVCFPASWPAQEEGAFVNCPHEHPIVWGQRVQITKERAIELGFGPKS